MEEEMSKSFEKFVAVQDVYAEFWYQRDRVVILSDNASPLLTRNTWKTVMTKCWFNGNYIEFADGRVMDRNGMCRGRRLYVFHYHPFRYWWRDREPELRILDLLEVAPVPVGLAAVRNIEMCAGEPAYPWLESNASFVIRAEELLPNVSVTDKEILLDLLRAEVQIPVAVKPVA
jgi:hypothetical protein